MNHIGRSLMVAVMVAVSVSAMFAQERAELRPNPQNQQIADGARQCPSSCPVRPFWRCVLVYLAVIHLILAFWVFTDQRKRGEGHGIFVVLALLAGIPATMLYALVRIGDIKRAP
jgi:hypothetical protein